MSATTSQTILNLSNVKKVFGRGTIDEVKALNGVNLNVLMKILLRL